MVPQMAPQGCGIANGTASGHPRDLQVAPLLVPLLAPLLDPLLSSHGLRDRPTPPKTPNPELTQEHTHKA
jgi:hypothetical protein